MFDIFQNAIIDAVEAKTQAEEQDEEDDRDDEPPPVSRGSDEEPVEEERQEADSGCHGDTTGDPLSDRPESAERSA